MIKWKIYRNYVSIKMGVAVEESTNPRNLIDDADGGGGGGSSCRCDRRG